MRERPILLNGDMVRAVLNGSKTQTRRIIDWRRTRPTEIAERDDGSKWPWSEDCENGGDYWHDCPFGEVGDRLWVRESFYEHGHWQGGYDPEDSYFVSDKQVLYPADGIHRPAERKREDFWRSRPSIHMPRWASRITLEITGVRVERLASVSNEDARAEGYPANRAADGGNSDTWLWFRDLWDGIYPEQSFKVNPWVWVIEFERVEGE